MGLLENGGLRIVESIHAWPSRIFAHVCRRLGGGLAPETRGGLRCFVLVASEPQARATVFALAFRKPPRPLVHALRTDNALEPWGSEARKYRLPPPGSL